MNTQLEKRYLDFLWHKRSGIFVTFVMLSTPVAVSATTLSILSRREKLKPLPDPKSEVIEVPKDVLNRRALAMGVATGLTIPVIRSGVWTVGKIREKMFSMKFPNRKRLFKNNDLKSWLVTSTLIGFPALLASSFAYRYTMKKNPQDYWKVKHGRNAGLLAALITHFTAIPFGFIAYEISGPFRKRIYWRTLLQEAFYFSCGSIIFVGWATFPLAAAFGAAVSYSLQSYELPKDKVPNQ